MCGLLNLPREIRDAILTLAIPWQQSRPASLDEINLRNRHTITKVATPLQYMVEMINFEKRPRYNTMSSLSLTNKQLHKEVMEYTHSKSKLPLNYELDLIYVYGRGIFPTWTYIPLMSNTVDTVHVTMRVMGRKGRAANIWGPFVDHLFIRSEPSPDGHMLMFWHILQVFLTHGPWPTQCPTTIPSSEHETCEWCNDKQKSSDLTLKNLIIDILPTPARDGAKYPSDELDSFGEFNADNLASLTEHYLDVLVDHTAPIMLSSAYNLCSQVNYCEVKSNGTRIGTHHLPGIRTAYQIVPHLISDSLRKDYAQWVVDITQRRLQLGLPIPDILDRQREILENFQLFEKYETIIANTNARSQRIYIHHSLEDDTQLTIMEKLNMSGYVESIKRLFHF